MCKRTMRFIFIQCITKTGYKYKGDSQIYHPFPPTSTLPEVAVEMQRCSSDPITNNHDTLTFLSSTDCQAKIS